MMYKPIVVPVLRRQQNSREAQAVSKGGLGGMLVSQAVLAVCATLCDLPSESCFAVHRNDSLRLFARLNEFVRNGL
jgi:hypothetical protein